ncbi:DUF6265 family protein [Sphingobacterium spiritivorum]|uniref:DUF6265 family protein n=1 Tax=Sphingobacterium spiritivorum TaxID=258 RepID=UPI003DA20E56
MKISLKYLAIILSAFVFTMCVSKQNSPAKAVNFDWISGNWQRTNEEKGKTTLESWEKLNDSAYHGIGFTLRDKDTISQEQMQLIKTNGNWNLLVKAPEEKEFTKFRVSDISTDSFTCKNDSLSFPKQIKYWKNGENLHALVSGDSTMLSFEFEKL